MIAEAAVLTEPADPRARVEALRRTMLDTLSGLLAGVREYALIYFPHSPNVGDSAIYLGQLAGLRDLGLPPPRFVCDLRTYDRAALARAIGDGPILLSGGGNFGDLWPLGQQCREEVLRSFPRNRILQLPQSLHFGSGAALQRARDAVNGHPDFTLLVRDRGSFALARDELQVPAVLCPDMAFGLGPLQRTGAPRQPNLWLLRQDHEAAVAEPVPGLDDERRDDWCEERGTILRALSYRLMGAVRRPALSAWFRPALMAVYPRLARQRLRRGLRLLCSADLVITDRLHGHILALMLAIPHVVLDDRFGKVSRFRATWTAGVTGVLSARSRQEALELVRQLPERATAADHAWA